MRRARTPRNESTTRDEDSFVIGPTSIQNTSVGVKEDGHSENYEHLVHGGQVTDGRGNVGLVRTLSEPQISFFGESDISTQFMSQNSWRLAVVVPASGFATQVCFALVNIPAHCGLGVKNSKIRFGDEILDVMSADVALEETALFFRVPQSVRPDFVHVSVSIVSDIFADPSSITFTYIPMTHGDAQVVLDKDSQLTKRLVEHTLIDLHVENQHYLLKTNGSKDMVRQIQKLENFFFPRFQDYLKQIEPGLLKVLNSGSSHRNGTSWLDLTPLHIAAEFGWGEFVNSLLAKNVEVNQVDHLGNTARDWAYMHDRYAVLQVLSLHGGIANSSTTVMPGASRPLV